MININKNIRLVDYHISATHILRRRCDMKTNMSLKKALHNNTYKQRENGQNQPKLFVCGVFIPRL